jgi:tRNA nucleotidyltransferase (CCA-adding enzyme)
LGCGLEEYTYDMIKELNYKILEVSKERWVSELDKLLMGQNPKEGLEVLTFTRLINYMLPELSLQVDYDQNNPHHTLNLWEHTIKVVEKVPLDIEIRWAALLHDIAKPFMRKDKSDGTSNYHKHDLVGAECVLKIADYLKWSNERKNNVYNLVLHHMDDNSPLRKADMEAK